MNPNAVFPCRTGLLVIVASASFACTNAATTPPGTPNPASAAQSPFAAYVILVEAPDHDPVPFARVIVPSGQACPTLAGAPQPISMTKRDNPHGFVVDVCEAVVPFEQALKVQGSSFTLPAAHRKVQRVTVIGDTGCKPGDQSDCSMQDPQWPFPALTKAAAAAKPDLVLHMGDYNYRGTPSHFNRGDKKVYYYDAGDGAPADELCGLKSKVYYSQNVPAKMEGSAPDTWDAWWLDFFQPATPLLAAAPWIVARGNHELCSHAGPGWLYFLGPSSKLPEGGGTQVSCPSQAPTGPLEDHLVFVPPQLIALDGVTVANVDSANACDVLNNFSSRYAEQFASIAARLDQSGRGSAWLMGHRPPWGVEDAATAPPASCENQPGTGPAPAFAPINLTLQCAFASAPGSKLLPKLSLSFAGHMHRFESLTFAAGGRPPQIIAGNGGVLEDTTPPTGAFSQVIAGQQASGFSVEQFGFVQMDRAADGSWTGSVIATNPTAWSTVLPACGTSPASGKTLCVQGIP